MGQMTDTLFLLFCWAVLLLEAGTAGCRDIRFMYMGGCPAIMPGIMCGGIPCGGIPRIMLDVMTRESDVIWPCVIWLLGCGIWAFRCDIWLLGCGI